VDQPGVTFSPSSQERVGGCQRQTPADENISFSFKERIREMIKKFFFVVILVFLSQATALGEYEAGPVIMQYFASRQTKPGEPWKVYINAQSTDREMKAFILKVSLPGGAVCPLAQTEIKKISHHRLSGYLTFPTKILDYLEPESLVLDMKIKDKAGRLSTSVSLPLVIDPKAQMENPPAGVFKEKNLGLIKQACYEPIIIVGAAGGIKNIDP
jgi:hypothetical protein